MTPILAAADLNAFLKRECSNLTADISVLDLKDDWLLARLRVRPEHLRPGGTVSGPSLFTLVDVSMYLGILAHIGIVPLAVTTSSSIDFLRKPAGGIDLLAKTRLLKLGRTLAVGDVIIKSLGSDLPVARASLTYALPRKDI
ncbi:MAG: PaaI family thioesterase [Paracoccaceae bacterium]|jgi:uncharacterized protein (TIGR00369 family)